MTTIARELKIWTFYIQRYDTGVFHHEVTNTRAVRYPARTKDWSVLQEQFRLDETIESIGYTSEPL